MKPYVICHMNSSVDGRILGSRWRPSENRMAGLFERIHEKLGGGSEPGLETLRRQMKHQLDEIIGEGMIEEVLIPRCIPYRQDF